MPRTPGIPAYVLHRPTGQARCRIHGKDHYLGKHGSPESLVKYDELIGELLANRDGACSRRNLTQLTVTALLASWWPECKRRYGGRGKGQFGNAGCWRPTIRMLREAFGDLPADELGPKRVRELIESQAREHGWSLTYARDHMTRIRMILKWAVSEELLKVDAYERLRTAVIRHGKRTQPLPPVSDELVEQTLPLLRPRIKAMVQLQRLTGMRPGELVGMRVDDVERSGDVWIYTPSHHKTSHRGKSRSIYIGPQAQAILAPWLLKASKFIFPASGQGGSPYTSDSYRRAIQRVCEKHKLERWSPYQLRKTCATAIRSALDVEAAASILGHSSSIVTQDHYAAADTRRALDAARRLG